MPRALTRKVERVRDRTADGERGKPPCQLPLLPPSNFVSDMVGVRNAFGNNFEVVLA